MSCPKKTKGFTLIELMISITVMAILASIGFIVYSQAQATGRDARRKSDIKALQGALELYYQKNGKYPPNSWQFSCQTQGNTTWITGVDSNYINYIPHDPKSGYCPSGPTTHPDSNPGDYDYVYLGDATKYSECSSHTPGDWYILYTQLENRNDNDGIGTKNGRWCNGDLIYNGHFGLSYVYAITSQ